MRFLGNLIWLLLGGLITALVWSLLGIAFCITIIGVPVGIQCFKFAGLTLAPFGKSVRLSQNTIFFNILWLIFFGWELASAYVVFALLNYITIIGIPFGRQSMKLAALAAWPFGAVVTND